MMNALTVDVEEYFHPSEIQRSTSPDDWDSLPSRIEYQTDRVLKLLDRHSVVATFFILGWVAERKPQIVRRVLREGHEIGCHSYSHRLVYDLTISQFRQDTLRAVRAIQDAAGISPRVYRAPSYSITERSLWALEVLVQCGFRYDSSIVPVSHDRYGLPGFQRFAQMLNTPSGEIMEIPVATTKAAGTVIPIGGGGYLRLLPYRYTSAGIRRLNLQEKQPACIYFHPWEIDPDQPRLAQGWLSSTRTYMGLCRMEQKLDRLMTEFRFGPISSVYSAPQSAAVPSIALPDLSLVDAGPSPSAHSAAPARLAG